MVVDIIGILEDGSARSARLPSSAAQSLRLPLGSVATLRMSVVTAANIPVRLAGSTLSLCVKRSFLDTTPLFTLGGTLLPGVAPNRCNFNLPVSVQKQLTAGRYVYDAWLLNATTPSRDQVKPLASIVFSPTALPISASGTSPTPPATAPNTGIYRLNITQAMINAGSAVLVPTDFIPTAGFANLSRGANVSDLLSFNGTAQVVVAMNDGVNPSPFVDGDVVVITAIQ